METKFREKFEKDLDSIQIQKVLNDIEKVIKNVENATTPKEIHNLKKLHGDKNAFRIKIGKYRIGIYIIHNTVEFTRVLHRDKIYDYFPE